MTLHSLDSTFCKSILYRTLDFFDTRVSKSPPTVRENAPFSGCTLTERHVQCLWYDDSLRPTSLASDSGEKVTVADPGRWNLEAGPDFLDAALCVGDNQAPLKGDIEIHLAPRDWTAHNHGSDPAYSRVIAHVCLQDGPRPASLPSDAVQISFSEALRAEGRSFLRDIDTTAYPYSLPSGRTTSCSKAFVNLPYETQIEVLSSAGQERLRLKADRISRQLEGREPAQVLYEEIMGALGYKQNRRPFRALAMALPYTQLQELSAGNAVKAYALLMGRAGLLPNSLPEGADEESRSFLRQLWDHWWRHESILSEGSPVSGWRTDSVRPQNLPTRRIAAAACIFCGERPFANLLEPDTTIPYWSCRLSLGGKPQNRPITLLGKERKAAMTVNVVAPFVAACGGTAAHLLAALPPLDFNAVTKEMMNALMGADYNAAKYRAALTQQGLIQIFGDYCLDQRNTCDRCPFAVALGKMQRSRIHRRS